MVDLLLSEPTFSFVTLALAILAILLAVVFYIRSQHVKRPCFSRQSKTIIGSALLRQRPIEVRVRGEPISQLTLTLVAIWNDGRATIVGNDIVSSDPVRIVPQGDGKILAAEVIAANRESNQLTIEHRAETNDVLVSFDFLDHKNGAVIEVYHTGDVLDESVLVTGSIKGANIIIHSDEREESVARFLIAFDEKVIAITLRVVPDWLFRAVDRAETTGPLALALVVLPMMIVFIPVMLIYVIGAIVVIPILFVMGVASTWRPKLPRELYRVMKYH